MKLGAWLILAAWCLGAVSVERASWPWTEWLLHGVAPALAGLGCAVGAWLDRRAAARDLTLLLTAAAALVVGELLIPLGPAPDAYDELGWLAEYHGRIWAPIAGAALATALLWSVSRRLRLACACLSGWPLARLASDATDLALARGATGLEVLAPLLEGADLLAGVLLAGGGALLVRQRGAREVALPVVSVFLLSALSLAGLASSERRHRASQLERVAERAGLNLEVASPGRGGSLPGTVGAWTDGGLVWAGDARHDATLLVGDRGTVADLAGAARAMETSGHLFLGWPTRSSSSLQTVSHLADARRIQVLTRRLYRPGERVPPRELQGDRVVDVECVPLDEDDTPMSALSPTARCFELGWGSAASRLAPSPARPRLRVSSTHSATRGLALAAGCFLLALAVRRLRPRRGGPGGRAG
ncbi:MAG: hypothetical protein VYE22_17365 [Myxococcota bacterium]|nr:hypothetical protein [Myxococcota bacterium]